ncbi:hypothetical protein MN608_05713 [Microdochium nivale]|nr:hypothetical protein MN608_05713 [Microdochium nivale]
MSPLLPSAPAPPDSLLASTARQSSPHTRTATTSAVSTTATAAATISTSQSRGSSGSRRGSLPFVFRPPFNTNTPSSTSVVSSTAEGRPIPLDNSTAAHRTSALRELNRTQPSSRHRYTRSTGAPHSVNSTTTGTYSQPVLVRTYSGPPPSSSSSRPAGRRVPLSNISITSSVVNWRPGRSSSAVVNMARSVKGKSKPQKHFEKSIEEARLPPLEAFTFKSIMNEMQQDIGADLDRIAEICARSRYSLSNQYEVHVAPHGSGTTIAASVPRSSKQDGNAGPTLQAITSDDEHSSSTRHRRKRGVQRRRSAAYGTLETIMSSSRSSDEDRSKKKSAAELTAAVRGRAGTEGSSSSDGAQNSSHATGPSSEEQEEEQRRLMRRKSSSFAVAVMDNTRQSLGHGDVASPRASGTALVSEPARPETSRNHLEIRTSPDDHVAASSTAPVIQQEILPQRGTHDSKPAQPSRAVVSASMASAAITSPEGPDDLSGRPGLFAGLSSWIPWRSSMGVGASRGMPITEVAASDPKRSGGHAARSKSYAEGTLRELLKTAEPSLSSVQVAGATAASADHKGKSVEHAL